MTRPRKELISVADTPYYHCVSRCVRRAFLCGRGKDYNFEHRRAWIVARLKQLADIFTIDIAAYAIMSNHYHVVLHVNQHKAQELSAEQIIERWRKLYKGPELIERYLAKQPMKPEELQIVDQLVEKWQQRLADISWFMRCLNEPIARRANKEDNCTGRFFEGRFKSQALLDERALLSCMVYVDLNPVRAAMADTPESSDYTSIQERLGITPKHQAKTKTKQRTKKKQGESRKLSQAELMPFAGGETDQNRPDHIPFHISDYIELADWTGRAMRDDKRGSINNQLPSILQRLNLPTKDWLDSCCHIENRFGLAIGPIAKITDLCQQLNQRWLHGLNNCRKLYPETAELI